jgi:hypothetical protein
MADELLSLRLTVVSPSPGGRALFRNAAAVGRVPIELVENDGEAAAGRSLAHRPRPPAGWPDRPSEKTRNRRARRARR